MRKETSASVIAGALSGGVLGFGFGAFSILTVGMGSLESLFKEKPILAPNAHTLVLITEAFLIIGYAAFGSLIGAISGFIFVKSVNKLPLRSTYIKAVLPWGLVLFAFTVLLSLIFHLSLNGVIGFVWWDFESYAALGAAAILFAYLFNRWSNHQQPNSNTQLELQNQSKGF